VETNNPVYTSVNGVLFNQGQTTLIQYPGVKVGSCSIPNSVTSIADEAFLDCTRLINVTIGNGVTSIRVGAFDDCLSLTNVTIGNSVTSIGDGAFFNCLSLPNVTIPNSVTNIGQLAFTGCTALTNVYFQGNAPSLGAFVFGGYSFQYQLDNATAYYLPGTMGWSTNFGGIRTALWSLPYPLILNNSLGVRSNQFGFIVSWATNLPVVVEAATSLSSPVWQPVQTNNLVGGSFYFSDPQRANHPSRFYRVRSQ
jgi:hypothetical protein